MATFPTYATILLAGFAETPDYGVLRTPMDGGLAKQRARWTTPIVTRDATIMVQNKADKVLFDAWMKTDLTGGVGWFTWVDQVDGVSKQARIVGGAIKWTTPGIAWLAQCQVETLG